MFEGARVILVLTHHLRLIQLMLLLLLDVMDLNTQTGIYLIFKGET